MLFNSLSSGAFAQALEPVYAPVLPPSLLETPLIPRVDSTPMPLGSAPLDDDPVQVVPESPQIEFVPQTPAEPSPVSQSRRLTAEEYFSAPESRSGFKLFEPSRYDFLQDDTPMLLPQAEEGEEDFDNYYRYSRQYLENVMRDAGHMVRMNIRGIEYLEILNPSLLVPIFGTTISLTGRKTFGLNYVAKKYKGGSRIVDDRNFSGLEFTQEMQLKLQGKVSDRIFVDIDYDDQRPDAQNIAIAYRGKGDEFVQSADFGDIQLSLPNTEFLSYNKQVFGASMHLKYGNADLRLIGSQTKGESKSRQFHGDSVFETVNIRDIQYIRRKYYDLSFGETAPWTTPITPGSERVYLDDHTSQGYQEALIVDDMAVPSTVYPSTGATARFRLLTRGVDYSVDYNRNILIFNMPLKETDIVAVDYQNINGLFARDGNGTGRPKLIKTPSDRPINTDAEIGWQLEIKRYYDIGARQITRDNGQGNFTLRLLESDGREACPPSSPPNYCKFTVDYEKGLFEITGAFPDPGVYATTPASAANRYFFVQFSSSVRTYFLEPDIVVQSETVKINGASMARNRDYYVDYASGFITFYNQDLIGPGSVIDVFYETVAGGANENALLGGRLSYDFTRNISVGASLLNESGAEPRRVPQVGALANSLTVMEADFKAKDIEVIEGVKISAGVEAAQSRKDENLFGSAMIDNLEETKESIRVSTVFNEWIISSNPGGLTSFFDAIKWDTQQVKAIDINPAGSARSDAMQNVLTIDYDFTIADNAAGCAGLCSDHDEVSIVFPISAMGADFTKKTILELITQGVTGGPDINISFGTVDERSDLYDFRPAGFSWGDIFPECSKYYSAPPNFFVPKTEDLRCTGLITPQEDVGWLFVNPDYTYQRYDPFRNNKFNREPQPNGRIDTQDLNGNGLYDFEDPTAGGSFGYNGIPITGCTTNAKGWEHCQQEVDFSDPVRWGAIKQIRVTLRKNAPNQKGTVNIAHLAVSGSTWQPPHEPADASAYVFTYGINNLDNTDYKPIFSDTGDGGQVFRSLYGSINDFRIEEGANNIREQSLAIDYDFTALTPNATDVFVQRNFSRMDFSQHRQFRFLLYNPSPPSTANTNNSFYLRILSDDNNYSEIEIPLDFTNEWRLYSLKLIDTNGDGVPERWENNSAHPVGSVTNVGYLNFRRIGIIRAGVRTDNPLAFSSGEVWLNEIHLTDSVMTVGNAYMAEAKIDVDNWFEAGGKYTRMDGDFQTPLAVPAKQSNTKEEYYLKFKRIKDLPITANYHRSNTITPDALDFDRSNTVSLIDAGEVKRSSGNVLAEYTKPFAPRVGVEYAFEDADYSKLERSDNMRRYGATVDYSPGGREPLLKNISAGAMFTQNKINYNDIVIQGAPSLYYDTDEKVQSYNFRLSLQPLSGVSIVPSYTLSTADEKRRYFDASQFKDKHYDKSASQSAGVSAALRLTKWLAPTMGYTVTTRENNNLSPVFYSSGGNDYDFEVGDVKSINRLLDANVALTLNGREILPKSRLFAGFTVSGAYKLQDGDSWENVDSSFTSLDKLWVRGSMGLNAPYTYRSNMTLRDTYTSALRWTPLQQYALDGWAAPFKTLSIINNFTKSFQTTENIGSSYDSETTTLPDLIVVMDNMEKLLGTGSFMTGTNLKLRYRQSATETAGTDKKDEASYGGDLRFVLFNYFDNTLSYTEQTLHKTDTRPDIPAYARMLEDYLRRDLSAQSSFNYKRVRFTPKFTYLYDTRSQTGDVLVNDVQELVPSLNIRADFNLPYGLKLPFVTRRYLVTNRVVWNTNISYSRRRSFTVTENRDLLDINTNFDYEISKNIRLTISGAFQDFKHVYIAEESYTAYTIGTLLTLQF